MTNEIPGLDDQMKEIIETFKEDLKEEGAKENWDALLEAPQGTGQNTRHDEKAFEQDPTGKAA